MIVIGRIRNALTAPGIMTGYLYFFIHAVVEILCFYCLARVVGDSVILWTLPLLYDVLAFVPQSVIGRFCDRFPRFPIGLTGLALLIIGFVTFSLDLLPGAYTEIAILSIGNACLHVAGAEVTLRASDGRLSHAAIFVSGGSFGVITGKLLGNAGVPFFYLLIPAFLTVPLIILAEKGRRTAVKGGADTRAFGFNKKGVPLPLVIFLAVTVVAVRGYMGYGIPTAWNKTVWQTVLLYVCMGTGKALGGILSDAYGIKKTAIISVLGALPFLLFGDRVMVVSLIGILLFSMTMAITLGILVSATPRTPGLAFGWTTIGLTLGTLPVFFVKFANTFTACAVITVLSAVCLIGLLAVLPKDKEREM